MGRNSGSFGSPERIRRSPVESAGRVRQPEVPVSVGMVLASPHEEHLKSIVLVRGCPGCHLRGHRMESSARMRNVVSHVGRIDRKPGVKN